MLFKIELLSPPDPTPKIEVIVHRPNNHTLTVRVLTPTPLKVDKATR